MRNICSGEVGGQCLDSQGSMIASTDVSEGISLGIFLVGKRWVVWIPSQVFIRQDEAGALRRGPFIRGWFAHIKKRDNSAQFEGKHRLCAVICIITLNNYSMRILSGVIGQKFRDVVDDHVIHTALHGAKQMMRKVWDVDRLVDNQVEPLAAGGVGKFHHSAYCRVAVRAKCRVESGHFNRSVIVVDN